MSGPRLWATTPGTITGPGRPDTPATTGGLITGKEPVGMEYRSTDGAGVGAWVWRKRPDGWMPTEMWTGWRSLKNSWVLADGTPWEGLALFVARSAQLLHFRIYDYLATSPGQQGQLRGISWEWMPSSSGLTLPAAQMTGMPPLRADLMPHVGNNSGTMQFPFTANSHYRSEIAVVPRSLKAPTTLLGDPA
ncbi:MAG: hypothetical protein Q4G35_03185 [Propionibacteriaceae bacterium]|nr:hypothetical protein [Propionibacteriaceae bacterium]